MNYSSQINLKKLVNTPDDSVRIGMICPYWLPRHGGGEQYDYRLGLELTRRGFKVNVFTGTSSQVDKDNGDLEVSRHVSQGDVADSTWRMSYQNPKGNSINRLIHQYSLMSEAVKWCIENKIQIVLISNPWQQTEFTHARELYLQLKTLGIKTGLIHFDLAQQVQKGLLQIYQQSKSWATAKNVIQRSIKKIYHDTGRLQALYQIGSPLFFEPDFVISCSEWSSAFIDPEDSTKKIILHPILDSHHWAALPKKHQKLSFRDVLMVNPSNRKGPKLMAELIKSDQSDMSFRVLKGGWGDSFKTFIPMVSETTSFKKNRVEFLDYVMDARHAYRSAGLIFFPSLYEGYGMTAVEPMFAGTPVVSSNYPAIIEAVGSGALSLCPYLDTPERWGSAVSEVLGNRNFWAQRSLDRCEEINVRQELEINHLCEFLSKQLVKAA